MPLCPLGVAVAEGGREGSEQVLPPSVRPSLPPSLPSSLPHALPPSVPLSLSCASAVYICGNSVRRIWMAAVFRLAVCFCSGQADSVDEKHKSVRLLTRQLLRD